jgi:hypothetical protein
MRVPKWMALGVASASAAALALGVIATASGSPSNASLAAAPSVVTGPVQRVDSALADRFAVLRSAPGSEAPSEVRDDFAASPLTKQLGLNIDLAHGVLTAASSIPVWIVPGEGSVCMWIKDPVDGAGISCDPTSKILQSGLLITLIRPGDPHITIAGLVPDGVNSVQLQDARSSDRIATQGGTFGATNIEATDVAFDLDGSTHTVPLVRP